MTPIQKVLEKFPTAERSREGWRSCCPAHDDLHPSLSIAEGTDGRVLLNCHAGCTAEEICRSVGLSMQDLFPPVVSQEPHPAYQPFPVDVLPGPLKEFTTMGAASMACDPAYLALPLLSALGASIGNSRRLRIKRGWDVPPIIWSVLIGESGTTKTPAFKLVMRCFYARQGEHLKQFTEDTKQHQIDLSKWEKEMAAWKRDKSLDSEPPEKPIAPQAQRFLVSDTTVEALAPMFLQNPRGLMLSRDELSGWLGSFDRYSAGAGGDAAHWLSMFNAEPLIVDRKTGIPRTIFVPRASICISGGIQPGPFNRALGVEHRESGLAPPVP